VFTQRTEYDALNRMTRLENWHRAGQTPAIYRPEYNRRGILAGESLTVRGQVTEAILNIDYDAKGQRTRMQYGNGTTTRYHYDPQTFRLVQLRTTRTSPGERLPDPPSNLSNPNVLQNLYYTYDPVGNITEIHDDAYEPVFFNNQMVEPRNRYTYDALYRLIEATGRENYQAESAPDQIEEAPFTVRFPVGDRALRNYTQFYTYDAVGNIQQMRHGAERGSWTRNYAYAGDSNRLLRTWKGDDTVNAVVYDYDTHGSMLNLYRTPDDYRLRWDYRDMIHQVNLGGGGQAFYNYDADKQRTRKRIERNNGGNTVEERLYLGGMELYRRWVNGNLVEEIETHHLFVDEQRVLIVEDVLSTNNPNLTAGVLYRYQYSNHLGSVGLELNGDAAVISYEEYHPYGTAAYRAVNAGVRAKTKRYRYTGMERDEETGLSYHTARYYSPWLGRWVSCDPLGIVESTLRRTSNSINVIEGVTTSMQGQMTNTESSSRQVNLFVFVNDNPLGFVDSDGREPKPAPKRFAPDQPALTLDNFTDRALTIPNENQVPIELGTPSFKQNERRFGSEGAIKGCYEAACAMANEGNQNILRKAAPHLLGRDYAIQIAISEDRFGRIVVDPSQAERGLRYIDRALQEGYRVVVGVSYSTQGTKSNPLTEHFVTIIGRYYDPGDRVFYKFLDPGLKIPSEERPDLPPFAARLYVDKETKKLFRVPIIPENSRAIVSHQYDITQVRTYKELSW
jgi:RHS repeat-associated protein